MLRRFALVTMPALLLVSSPALAQQNRMDDQFVVNRSIEALINAGATSINTFGVMVQ